jgi:hypothetical protein
MDDVDVEMDGRVTQEEIGSDMRYLDCCHRYGRVVDDIGCESKVWLIRQQQWMESM